MEQPLDINRLAAAGSKLAQLELAKASADPQARRQIEILQDRRRIQLLSAIFADLRRDP